MPIITDIKKLDDRIDIYIDNKYCRSIKPKVWEDLRLPVGWKITCRELGRIEILYRNQTEITSFSYQKKRILRIEDWLKRFLPEIEQKTVVRDINTRLLSSDCGINLSLFYPKTQDEIAAIKIIGIFAGHQLRTFIKGKVLEYAANNLHRDVWIADCEKIDTLSITWLKPIIEQDAPEHGTLKQASSSAFNQYTSEQFIAYIRSKLGDE